MIAPTPALRDRINRIIPEELLAEGEIRGPAGLGSAIHWPIGELQSLHLSYTVWLIATVA